MAVHRYQIALAADSLLPRDRLVNTVHFDHTGAFIPDDVESVCEDLADLWGTHFSGVPRECVVTAYDVGPKPNEPIATAIVNAGLSQQSTLPREVSLCLSYYNDRHSKRKRGRIYIPMGIRFNSAGVRPTTPQMQAVLDLYSEPNNSLPDIGGVNVVFGVYSGRDSAFYPAKGAWVDDEWDTQRRRGLKPTTRLESVRQG